MPTVEPQPDAPSAARSGRRSVKRLRGVARGAVPRPGRLAGRAAQWQQGLERRERVTLLFLGLLTAGAVVVRGWFTLSYRPAFLGFNDSYEYLISASRNIFRDAQRPAGYPFFLRLLHHFSDHLLFVVVVQHTLGILAGLLLYLAVRRAGGPPWLGLLPAAIAFFCGTGIFVEHTVLNDSAFVFLQALTTYVAIRCLDARRWLWALLAGLLIGVSFWLRTVAISALVLIPVWLLFAARGGWRRRLASGVVAAAAALTTIGFYVGAQAHYTGYVGLERQSAWNLYAHVATFANCSDFTPPKGTRFLCAAPRSLPPAWYQYSAQSPAVRRFGVPDEASPLANTTLQRFATAAMVGQPLDWVGSIFVGFGVYVFPNGTQNYSPDNLAATLLNQTEESAVEPAVALLYPHSVGYRRHSVPALLSYERHTRVQGALMIALLVCTFAGWVLLPSRLRAAALLFGLTALLSMAAAIAGNGYDARYAADTFGPLGASAALGAYALTVRGRRLVHALRV